MTLSRRQQTEQRIMQALEDQICESGMVGVGVNAIAKRAGVSKELIYRYFDGLPGLMLQWMQTQDFWTGKSAMLLDSGSEERSLQQIILGMLNAQIDALSKNDALKEIRRWELIERNEVSAKLADRREKAARMFIDELSSVNDNPGTDIPAMISVMLAGVLYLSLRSKTESHFLGVPIRTEEGWLRITAALEQLSNSLPDSFKDRSLGELRDSRGNTEKPLEDIPPAKT